MPTTVTIREDQVLITLDKLSRAVANTPDMLRIVGAYMRQSIAKTFRDEGSPAGSWPDLAPSTMKRKGYGPGHRLLILSGRLLGSISYAVEGNTVRIGTGLVYARVQFQGSADRQGSQAGGGPKTDDNRVQVSAYRYLRTIQKENKKRNERRIRVTTAVSAHERHQNLPARNALVFRPEDEGNILSAIDGYIAAQWKVTQ